MRKAILLLLMLCISAVLLFAATADMRPTSDVQTAWGVTGSGTGDCTTGSAEYGCINDDVDSADDGTTYISTSTANATQEATLGSVPGDFGSLTSLTLKVRWQSTLAADDLDRVDFWLEVSGTQVGGTKCFSQQDTNCSGTSCRSVLTGSWRTCSQTDSSWNSLSSSDLSNLTFVAQYINNAVAMGDNIVFYITAVEAVLDYNVAGAGPPAIKRRIVQID